MDYKDGDEITVNGKPCRIDGGALVPVVKRGPLGGELKNVDDCQIGEAVYLSAFVERSGVTNNKTIQITSGLFVETNVPPRPAFTPITAGEAAKLPDIVGRWVAVQVDGTYIGYGGSNGMSFERDDQILLIEGVDLP